ncbi:uncharacterized protein F54H12.2 [Trichonephila clavipes]|nr:uncharacterized protein F54H12.2 [Trichonephila clavipes]
MKPVSVSRHNRKQVLKNLYGGLRNEKPKAPRLKIGDVVRINKQKLHFEKGYEQNWRREHFIVFEIVQRIPIVYRLKDLQGEEIKVFYVYSDLISPQIVGDTQAPLLRIVRTKGKDGETISQYYDRPQYLPLVRHSFQTIQSELRLNSGDFVPFERGQIGSGLTHYKGINFQKGYGIGGIFHRLFRAALPFLVKGGKTIGKEVLMTGSRVASDVLSGENFKEAVKTRSRESGKKLAQKAIDRVQSMVGKGQYKRKHSPECVKSELELFNLPGTQTVIQDGQWKQFHPLSNVFDKAPVEFHISGSAEDYIDLIQTQLYVKAKIVKVDNTPITKDDTIGPVNLFLHSLFSQVDVSLNDRVVSNSSNTYPYRSYIETLLNHGYDSKTSQLTAELFYKDSDDGLKKRTEFLKEVQL